MAWWGAPKLPFIDGSVDIVMLDMPFGKTSKKVPKYYAKQRVPKVRLGLCVSCCVLFVVVHCVLPHVSSLIKFYMPV